MVILLIGQQGTGKSTLGSALEDRRRVRFVSGGVLIRREIKRETELGLRIREPIGEGDRILAEETYRLLAKELADLDEEHLVLDGFPYTAEEHGELVAVAGEPELVFLLEGVPLDQLVRRIERRLECPDCFQTHRRGEERCRRCDTGLRPRPEDQDREKINRRHRRWTTSERGLTELYEGRGILRRLDARLPEEELVAKALAEIDRCENPPS